MIIGFDGKRAVNNMTGLGNYSRLVIEELGERFRQLRNNDSGAGKVQSEPSEGNRKRSFGMHTGRRVATKDWQLLVYTPKPPKNPRLEKILQLENVAFHLPPPQGFQGALWRTFGVTNSLKADGCDIYHGLSNELPLNIRESGVKSVVTIHDLIYRRLPYCYKLPDRLIYDFKYGRSCRNADRIIAISERTKADIVEFYGVDPEKIDVIYQGCADIFRKPVDKKRMEEVRGRLQLPERYIVQVGTIEQRKNLELTLRAMTGLPQEVGLVIVGRDHHGYKPKMLSLARELGLESRLRWLEGVDFKDLPAIYSLAEVSAYPSRYEGFGIPVIEALNCGTPVVAATGSCLEEAGGDGGLYVSPDSPREMQEALGTLLRDAGKRSEMVAAGKEHVGKFNTPAMTDNILATYRKTLGEEKR